MDEELLQKLQKKDNHSKNQYCRLEHLANYMRKRVFDKDYKKNVIRLITYYSYIKKFDTKGYHECYIVPFSSYINKHYDESKTKAYFDGHISENEFLREFIDFQESRESIKNQPKKKTKKFQMNRKGLKGNFNGKRIKKGINNMYINTKYFLENISRKIPYVNKKKEIEDWWTEYLINLKEARQAENYADMNLGKQEQSSKK